MPVMFAELKQLLSDLVHNIGINCPNVLSAAVSMAGPEALRGLQGCIQQQ